MEDPIKSLLTSMGWTCDDLLQKLQEYKNSNTEEKNTTTPKTNAATEDVQNKQRSSDTTTNHTSETKTNSQPNEEHIFKKPAIPPIRWSKTFRLMNRKKLKLMHLRKTKVVRKYRNRYHNNKQKDTEYSPEDTEKEKECHKDDDEVRSQIKLQLELLRNRKKSTPISTLVDKDFINRATPESRKKRLTSVENKCEEETEEKAENEQIAVSNLEDVLQISDESGIMIVDVIGGYKSPPSYEPSLETHPDDTNTETGEEIDQITAPKDDLREMQATDASTNAITLTKTHNITKIKGWRNKKFLLADNEPVTPKNTSNYFEPVPCCSNAVIPYSESTYSAREQSQKVENGSNTIQKQDNLKSAFVSNALDEFLNEHSQLNISYEVPKLEAEQGITQNFTDTSLPAAIEQPFAVNHVESETETKKEETYKPKTLAEKRKLLKKDESTQNSASKATNNSESIKNETETSREMHYSTIYYSYKNTKLRIPVRQPETAPLYLNKAKSRASRRRGKTYMYVPFKRDVKYCTNKKPSLLKSLEKPKTAAVFYKPGPLRMKQSLQNLKSMKDWRTVIKSLPKVTLEVTPEFGKPFDPKISHFLDFEDAVIDSERLEFALSALKPKGSAETTQTFRFPVPYVHKQKFVLMREPVTALPQIESSTVAKSEKIADVIKEVINDLITAIETSEMSDSLIKEDDRKPNEHENFVKPMLPISKNVGAIIKHSKRSSKTCMELKRLSVKVIDVEVVGNKHDGTCTKPFCQLGCVCGSLECTPPLMLHCGQVNCMFECKCGYNESKIGDDNIIKLPVGTDLLSASTVSHLEDEAKKNLAPVEREFTQTVIQANDQTIVLGSGTRYRKRRPTKAPKKYSDFLDPTVFESVQDAKLQCVMRDIYERLCAVKLTRLKLDNVIPFCLVHNLYDCHCNFTATFEVTKPKRSATSVVTSSVAIKRPKPVLNKGPNCCLRTIPPKPVLYKGPTCCSRTMQVRTAHYKIRNSKPEYIPQLKKLLKEKEKGMSLFGDTLEAETATDAEIKLVTYTNTSNKRKRKQEIEVRKDDETDIVLTRNKKQKIVIQPKEKTCISVPQKQVVQPEQSSNPATKKPPLHKLSIKNLIDFDASKKELLAPTHLLKKEFLQLLGKKIDNTQFRLLPWSVLAERYQQGMLQVWFSPLSTSTKIIVTEDNQCPYNSYVNITNFEQTYNKHLIRVDIVRWLVSKSVPGNKNPSNIFAILTFRKTNWEICGICEKNGVVTKDKSDAMSISLINASASSDESAIQKREGVFKHKTVDGSRKYIPLINEEFCYRRLTIKQHDDEDPSHLDKNNVFLRLPLPSIGETHKWYMLHLKTGYSYISFPRNSYTIRHKDLLKAISVAKENGKTVVLKSEELHKHYSHLHFGIYAVPDYDDKIFIGPYLINEKRAVETLGFVSDNKSVLVKTDLYYKMTGQGKRCSGRWLIPAATESAETVTNKVVKSPPSILRGRSLLKSNMLVQSKSTEAEKPEIESTKAQSSHDTINNTLNNIAKDKQKISVDSQDPNSITIDSDDDVLIVNNEQPVYQSANRKYIITNVHALGYVEAYQFKDTKVIDVKWPYSKNIKRYSKPEDAIRLFERELYRVLIPVPSEFRITAKVVSDLDTLMYAPLNPKYLQGNYIVGPFGIQDLLTINPCILRFYGLNDENVLEVMSKRSKFILYDHCSKLAESFMPKNVIKEYTKGSEILERAVMEIKFQERTYEKLYEQKRSSELQRDKLLQHCFRLLKELSPEEEKKARHVLYNIVHPPKKPVQSDLDETVVETVPVDVDSGVVETSALEQLGQSLNSENASKSEMKVKGINSEEIEIEVVSAELPKKPNTLVALSGGMECIKLPKGNTQHRLLSKRPVSANPVLPSVKIDAKSNSNVNPAESAVVPILRSKSLPIATSKRKLINIAPKSDFHITKISPKKIIRVPLSAIAKTQAYADNPLKFGISAPVINNNMASVVNVSVPNVSQFVSSNIKRVNYVPVKQKISNGIFKSIIKKAYNGK